MCIRDSFSSLPLSSSLLLAGRPLSRSLCSAAPSPSSLPRVCTVTGVARPCPHPTLLQHHPSHTHPSTQPSHTCNPCGAWAAKVQVSTGVFGVEMAPVQFFPLFGSDCGGQDRTCALT
eukprot:1565752-Rhodomonas_salina.1